LFWHNLGVWVIIWYSSSWSIIKNFNKWPTTNFHFYNINKHWRLLLFKFGSLVHYFLVGFNQKEEFWYHLKIGTLDFLTKIMIFLFINISLINLVENSAFLSGSRKSVMFLWWSVVEILIVKAGLLNARQFRLLDYIIRLDCHPGKLSTCFNY
jgi:hypothetical protein